MPRVHLLILAIGVVLVLAAGLSGESDPPPAPPLAAAADAELGVPDLQMETAEISQFAADGTLAYRILAVEIVHYPDADHTLLRAPRMTLFRPGEPPWEISSERGRIIGGTELLDAGILPERPARSAEARERVLLEDDVVIQRQRPGEGFMELRTDLLRLYPAREYAETERPVIIDTQSGRTTARGLRADLGAGTIELGAAAERVETTLFPGTL